MFTGRKSMSEQEEVDRQITQGLEDALKPTAVESLRRTAPNLDSYPLPKERLSPAITAIQPTLREKALAPVTAPRQTISVDDNYVSNVRLSDQWMSDDWDKVAAFAITKMYSWQYMNMMEEIFRIGMEMNEEEGEPDPALIKTNEKAFQRWAKEKLNK